MKSRLTVDSSESVFESQNFLNFEESKSKKMILVHLNDERESPDVQSRRFSHFFAFVEL